MKHVAPEELKRILIACLHIGDAKDRLSDYAGAPFPSRVTFAHWQLDDDAWHIPHPNDGARELVFSAFMGSISKSSVVKQTCGVNTCVNPFHLTIMPRAEAKQREKGTWERRILAPDMSIVKQSVFEASLADPITMERRRKAERDAAKAKAEAQSAS